MPDKLQPFRFWCHKILPLVYDDSLSYYELLCKVVKYLNDSINQYNLLNDEVNKDLTELNEKYNALKSYVDDYFKNLDVQDEINNKLDTMAEDGTLDKLIYKLGIFIQNVISPTRVLRLATPSGIDTEVPNTNATDYGQGMCLITQDRIMLSEFNSQNQTNDTLLTEIDLTNHTIFRQVTLPLGHCNSITYNSKNNKIYIAPLNHLVNDSTTNWNSILVYDYPTLSLSDTINTDFLPYGIAIDKITGKMYVMSTSAIYDFNTETKAFTKLFDISINTGVLQNLAANNNKLFISRSQPNNIFIYDLDGTVQKMYPISTWNENNYFGELEACDIDDNYNMYLYSTTYDAYPSFRFNQVWRFNLVSGSPTNTFSYVGAIPTDLYVDINNDNPNPNGSQTNPYKYITEALIASRNPNSNSKNIRVTKNTYNEVIYIPNNLNVYFNGSSVYNIIISNSERCLVDTFTSRNVLGIKRCMTISNSGPTIIRNSSFKSANIDNYITIYNSPVAFAGSTDFETSKDPNIINDSPFPVQVNELIDLKVEDAYPSSNGTPIFKSCSLKAVNDEFDIPVATWNGLLNGCYKTFTLFGFITSNSAARVVKSVPITSGVINNIKGNGLTVELTQLYKTSDNNFTNVLINIKMQNSKIIVTSTESTLISDLTATNHSITINGIKFN